MGYTLSPTFCCNYRTPLTLRSFLGTIERALLPATAVPEPTLQDNLVKGAYDARIPSDPPPGELDSMRTYQSHTEPQERALKAVCVGLSRGHYQDGDRDTCAWPPGALRPPKGPGSPEAPGWDPPCALRPTLLTSCSCSAVSAASSRSSWARGPRVAGGAGAGSMARAPRTRACCLARSPCSSCSPASAARSRAPTLRRSQPAGPGAPPGAHIPPARVLAPGSRPCARPQAPPLPAPARRSPRWGGTYRWPRRAVSAHAPGPQPLARPVGPARAWTEGL